MASPAECGASGFGARRRGVNRLEDCAARCRACRPDGCRFATYSHLEDDCSLYKSCDTRRLLRYRDYQTLDVPLALMSRAPTHGVTLVSAHFTVGPGQDIGAEHSANLYEDWNRKLLGSIAAPMDLTCNAASCEKLRAVPRLAPAVWTTLERSNLSVALRYRLSSSSNAALGSLPQSVKRHAPLRNL